MPKIEISLDIEKELKNLIDDDVKTFAHNVLFHMTNPYVPMDSGMLSQNVKVDETGVEYEQPYADRQWNGEHFNFQKDKHSLATARWGEVAMQAHGEELTEAVEEYIIRRFLNG